MEPQERPAGRTSVVKFLYGILFTATDAGIDEIAPVAGHGDSGNCFFFSVGHRTISFQEKLILPGKGWILAGNRNAVNSES